MARGDVIRKDVVVIGGGFSGTALAVQLLRRNPDLSLAVIEKNASSAVGLAYGTEHNCHLLNVSAGQMSAFPAEPGHFLRWAQENSELPVDSKSFLPRALYGKYLSTLLSEAQVANPSDFDWIRDEAISIRREESGFNIRTRNGSHISAKTMVLASGNFPPGNLGIPGITAQSRCYERMAWSKKALEGLPEDGSVLLIGSGLTSVDMAIALHSKNFKGTIHMLSRHGLVPQCHGPCQPWPRFWNERSPRTARGLLRLVRDQVAAASTAGSDWRGVMDSLRPFVQQVWQSLPINERRRFLRHVRAYWEVHRHRVAPEIGRIFFGMMANGQIRVHSGRITRYAETRPAEHPWAEVEFRERSGGVTRFLEVNRVINCSGPETNFRKIESPLIANLFEQGMVSQDPLALGLDVDENGELIDSDGFRSRGLYALGAARKGLLWESTAVPELRVQAAELADHLVRNTRRQEVNTEAAVLTFR